MSLSCVKTFLVCATATDLVLWCVVFSVVTCKAYFHAKFIRCDLKAKEMPHHHSTGRNVLFLAWIYKFLAWLNETSCSVKVERGSSKPEKGPPQRTLLGRVLLSSLCPILSLSGLWPGVQWKRGGAEISPNKAIFIAEVNKEHFPQKIFLWLFQNFLNIILLSVSLNQSQIKLLHKC